MWFIGSVHENVKLITKDHKYGILHQDHFTDIQNGDMDGLNNASESINQSLKKFSSGAKNLKTVFRNIHNFKTDNSNETTKMIEKKL